jgi:hypothetical protein
MSQEALEGVAAIPFTERLIRLGIDRLPNIPRGRYA